MAVTTALAICVFSALAIVAIWLGYPLLMFGLASMRSRAAVPSLPTAEGDWPTLTAILATRESAPVVRARVANLLASDYPAHALDVLVVLDAGGASTTPSELHGSFRRTDGSAAANVRVLVGDAPGGKACSLNAAVREATGELLLMADSQQYFAADTARRLAAALGDQRFGAVSGALTLGGDGRSPVHRYWALEKRLRRAEAVVHSAIGVTGAVYAVRRALWPTLPVGTILDDVYVPMALVLAGHRVGFEPAATATDARTFDAKAEQGRKARTLTGVLQLCRLLPAILSPVRNPVWLQFVAHKLLRLTTPLFVLTGALGGVWMVVELLRRWPTATLLALASMGGVVLSVRPLRVTAFGALQWGVAMQMAVARGVINGVRGRWAVWTASR